MKTITIFVTILIVFCVTPVYPVIYMNYWCKTLNPECPAYSPQPGATTQDVFEGYNDNLAYLQAKAAANFLTASGNWNFFLAKIEMAEVSQVDYIELSNILNRTILRVEEAENIFARIAEASRQYQLNPIVTEKLKNFDYKWFCVSHNLNIAIISEIECDLSTGDILGIPNRIREQLSEIKIQLKGFVQSIQRQNLSIDEMYTINQNMLSMALLGQYAAMIFREVRLE